VQAGQRRRHRCVRPAKEVETGETACRQGSGGGAGVLGRPRTVQAGPRVPVGVQQYRAEGDPMAA
jgi:hypothetical protein